MCGPAGIATCFLARQEKGRMATDLKRLKQHFKAYEPTLKELERKYQVRTPKPWKRKTGFIHELYHSVRQVSYHAE